MIVGIGTDIIEIKRIEQAISRWGKNFLDHIFNTEEVSYASQFKHPAQHYAARFAAKEAIFKAIGDEPDLNWKDITILNDNHGKPYCRLKNPRENTKILISLSHSKFYAVASAIITTE